MKMIGAATFLTLVLLQAPSPAMQQYCNQALSLADVATHYVENWSVQMGREQARLACERVLQLSNALYHIETRAWALFMQTRNFSDYFLVLAISKYNVATRLIAAALHWASVGELSLCVSTLELAKTTLKSAFTCEDMAKLVP